MLRMFEGYLFTGTAIACASKHVHHISRFSHLFYSSTFHFRNSCVCISRLYCPSCFDRYYKLWQFFNLDEVTTVTDLIGEGKRVCQMSHDELSAYNYGRNKYERNLKYLPKYCFMSSYVTTLLRDGFGFPTNEHIHFVDEVAGYKVSVVVGFSLRCLAGSYFVLSALGWLVVG